MQTVGVTAIFGWAGALLAGAWSGFAADRRRMAHPYVVGVAVAVALLVAWALYVAYVSANDPEGTFLPR